MNKKKFPKVVLRTADEMRDAAPELAADPEAPATVAPASANCDAGWAVMDGGVVNGKPAT